MLGELEDFVKNGLAFHTFFEQVLQGVFNPGVLERKAPGEEFVRAGSLPFQQQGSELSQRQSEHKGGYRKK